jgi:hypothetical protein
MGITECLFRAWRGRLDLSQAAIGRHWALLVQGFFAGGVVFPPLTPEGPRHWS